MKNRKLLGVLALASCVMLAGCNNGGTDPEPAPKPDPDPTPVVEVEIRVSELPEILTAGDVLDLEEYVTVFHASSYTVELKEESKAFATVDGHKITVTGEGPIDFVIKAGDKTKECFVNGLSEVRSRLAKAFENCGKNFSAMQLIYLTAEEAAYYEMGDEAGYFLYDRVFHGDGFAITESWDYDDQGYPLAGGFINLGDNEVYAMTYNETTRKYVADNYVYPSYYTDIFSPEFPVDFSSLPLVYDEEVEDFYLLLEGTDARDAAESMFMMFNGQYTPYHDESHETYDCAEVSAIHFYLDDEGEEGSPYYCAWCELEFTVIEEEIPVDQQPGTGHGIIPENPEVYVDTEMPYILDSTNTKFDAAGYAKAAKKAVGNKALRPKGTDYMTETGLSYYIYGLLNAATPSYKIAFSAYWTDNDGIYIETPEELGDYSFLKEFYSLKYVSGDGYVSYNCDANFEQFGDVASGLVKKDEVVYDVEGEYDDLHGYTSTYTDPKDDKAGNLRILFEPGVIEDNLVPFEPDIIGVAFDCPTHGLVPSSEVEEDEVSGNIIHSGCGEEIEQIYEYQYTLNLGRQNSFVTALCNADPTLKNIAAKFTALTEEGDDFWSFVDSSIIWDPLSATVTLVASLQFGQNEVYNFEIMIMQDSSVETATEVARVVSNLVIED